MRAILSKKDHVTINQAEAVEIKNWIDSLNVKCPSFYEYISTPESDPHLMHPGWHCNLYVSNLEELLHPLSGFREMPVFPGKIKEGLLTLMDRQISWKDNIILSAFKNSQAKKDSYIVMFKDGKVIDIEQASKMYLPLILKEEHILGTWVGIQADALDDIEKNLVTGTIFEYNGTVYEVKSHNYNQFSKDDEWNTHNHCIHNILCIAVLSNEQTDFRAKELYENAFFLSQPSDYEQRKREKNNQKPHLTTTESG